MPDDIEQRLAAAAAAARESQLCRQQHAQLKTREYAAQEDLEAAQQRCAGLEQAVGQLEHVSLTRVLAALHGARADSLAREQAQAEAARYQVAQAQQRLDAARADLESLEDRQAQLAGATRAYQDALGAKEQYLEHSGDPRGARLLALADERGKLTAELSELHRVSDDADATARALDEVREQLGTAASWSTFDAYVDRGVFASGVKNQRIDLAADAARTADQLLATLRSDLSELGGYESTAPKLEISEGFKFADIFFNNFLTDLAVAQHIRAAQDHVGQKADQVSSLQDQLRSQIVTLTKRLEAMDEERTELLAG
jgi:hypothetical protein